MVEGDGCHRVAASHRKSLVGRKFQASSPNGRFKDGVKAIVQAGGVLLRIEVHGKNLFYFFGQAGGAASVVVRIHFGMAGQFAAYQGEEPDLTATIRLRLESPAQGKLPRVAAHLSAMTVEHGKPDVLYAHHCSLLGPDPLREDVQADRFVLAAGQNKKAIGLLLMDQSFVAGVGNIYRSETLYEARIHPEQPGNTLTKAELLTLWQIVVRQMQAGFQTGSIWGHNGGPQCYGRATSACGGKVREWVMAGRNCYACSKQQSLDTKRPAATSAPTVRSGTKHLGAMTSAAQAEHCKRRTGEGLGVQHVALKDDATLAAARAAKKKPAAAVKRKPAAVPKAGAKPKASKVATMKRPSAAGGRASASKRAR